MINYKQAPSSLIAVDARVPLQSQRVAAEMLTISVLCSYILSLLFFIFLRHRHYHGASIFNLTTVASMLEHMIARSHVPVDTPFHGHHPSKQPPQSDFCDLCYHAKDKGSSPFCPALKIKMPQGYMRTLPTSFPDQGKSWA